MSQPSIICITGASSGIGAATARVFAKNGFRIGIGARRVEHLNKLKNELLELGSPAVFAGELDVTQMDSIANFVTKLRDQLGQPDILVNNAGGALGLETIADGNPEDWSVMIESNVLGLMKMTKAIVPEMIQRKCGFIINIGSIAGHQIYEKGGAYCAAKHGVKAITEVLKHELNEYGIRVCSIDPGMVETEFSVVRLRGDQEKAKAVYAGMTPLTANDIADCVYFAATRPAHVNIDNIIITPTDQASVHKVKRH